jgi:hypothetical protein
MFRGSGGGRGRLERLVARFREKGATSPEKAMTAQELGLPPRFEDAMKRRLGTTGIFVQVDGKYYLDEVRLQQVQQQRGGIGAGDAMSGQGASRRNMYTVRMVRMVVGIAAIILVVSNILFVESAYVRLVVVALVVVWIALTVGQMYYLSRIRRGWGASRFNNGTSRSPRTRLSLCEHFYITII